MKDKDKSQRAKQLTEEQRHVLLEKGTEPPFSGEYCNCNEEGVYCCAFCDQPLFSSDTKFDSGCGWPSFYDQLSENCIITEADHSHGMHRIEIQCAQCLSHLGHVFPDGPAPTGQRYCVNSVALQLKNTK